MNDMEDVIEQYKNELVGEAEIARGDLQEIEDHLRTLTKELRERGMSAADAVRAACVKLGDPRAVAREHAKVHSPFGARLSWGRTMSAALLLTFTVIGKCVFLWNNWERISAPQITVGMTVIDAMLVVALLRRLAWARAILFGSLAYYTTFGISISLAPPDGFHSPGPVGLLVFWAIPLGILAFVMPWRRRELHGAGYALVLQACALAATTTGPGSVVPAAMIASLPALVAIAGSITRARWAAWASASTAVLLLVAAIQNAYYFIVDVHEFEYAREWLPVTAMLLAGAIASAVASVASWRSARSTAGTLRYARY